MNCVYFYDWLFADSDGGSLQQQVMESDYVQFLCDSAVAVQGQKYVVSDEAVEYVREEFDTVAEEECGYFYIDSFCPDDLYPLWFETTAQYQHVVNCLKNGSEIYCLQFKNLNKATSNVDNAYKCTGIQVNVYKEGFFVGALSNGYAQLYYTQENFNAFKEYVSTTQTISLKLCLSKSLSNYFDKHKF